MPAMQLSEAKSGSSDLDSEYLQPFRPWYEMDGKYVQIPQVLNKPVHDCSNRVGDIGVTLVGDCRPLPELLASVMNCSTSDLRGQLVQWMFKNWNDIHIIEKWLVVRGLDLKTYAVHINSGGTTDGLEL